ncbi:MAG TPA: lipase maturation factor family protein [Terriglobia bacterium]|nr:lipase maturation factor family protein [Terriglobia bacterium]
MQIAPLALLRRCFGPGSRSGDGYLWPRWLFMRALGLIFFSAFYSFIFQIRGLIGPDGILPAGAYLDSVWQYMGVKGYWYAPTVLWLGSGSRALMLLSWLGLGASILLVLNLWPRGMTAVCMACYLSFIAAAQDFSSYQSDGMLLAAAFVCLFFAPPGLRPRLGGDHPPSWASHFLLQWLWFQIYFESGFVKMASHDKDWHNLTALDHYYENGPLPNWIGWYVQQLPHWFHAGAALYTLVTELGLVWMLFLPRRYRIICFFIVAPFQISIILTANLAFLNYLVLCLGIFLLDDRFLLALYHRACTLLPSRKIQPKVDASMPVANAASLMEKPSAPVGIATEVAARRGNASHLISGVKKFLQWASLLCSCVMLPWTFYATAALLLLMLFPNLPLPRSPIAALEPFRIANSYGLFAVMTPARFEIEFQGTRDGTTWTPYPFRYKPQDPSQPPKIHAPYQPRFDWNLWFASLGGWRENNWVVRTEMLLLKNDASVLELFAGNPFAANPPVQVRAVIWQYWFTDIATKRKTGLWWRREFQGLYAPTLEREPDGTINAVDAPGSVEELKIPPQ